MKHKGEKHMMKEKEMGTHKKMMGKKMPMKKHK